jgi:hypothetical protein
VPVVRIVDADLTMRMTEYVVLHQAAALSGPAVDPRAIGLSDAPWPRRHRYRAFPLGAGCAARGKSRHRSALDNGGYRLLGGLCGAV